MLGFAPHLPLGICTHAFVPLTLSNLEICLPVVSLIDCFFSYFFVFLDKSFSFLPRWWGGWGGEKIGNRTTHSGSESAQHLLVCWLWKWQALGVAVVVVLWGGGHQKLSEIKREKKLSVSLFRFSAESCQSVSRGQERRYKPEAVYKGRERLVSIWDNPKRWKLPHPDPKHLFSPFSPSVFLVFNPLLLLNIMHVDAFGLQSAKCNQLLFFFVLFADTCCCCFSVFSFLIFDSFLFFLLSAPIKCPRQE